MGSSEGRPLFRGGRHGKERLEAFHRDADIYIINRENVQWMVENVPFEFDAIVVDELSSFKTGTASGSNR